MKSVNPRYIFELTDITRYTFSIVNSRTVKKDFILILVLGDVLTLKFNRKDVKNVNINKIITPWEQSD
jgi:hypothetical protein